jgi:hypothetical protein
MDSKELMTARLQALLVQLDQAQRALASDGIDNNLRARVGHLFQEDLKCQRALVERDLGLLAKNQLKQSSWSGLQQREGACAFLFRECLAFLQGARGRGRDVDTGLCEIADTMLDELSAACELNWCRFTILADEEFFSDQVQIIRLRFPFCGIWDLPVAAHEFGHFAAYRLTVPEGDGRRSPPFKEYIDGYIAENQLRKEEEYYLNEYFADAFATYVLGPSYACTSLLLRFGVATALDEMDGRHPSYGKRAWIILDTLNRMNKERDSEGDFNQVVSVLRDYWISALKSAENARELSESDREKLNDISLQLYGILKGGARNARYNRWKIARKLQPALKPDGKKPDGEYEIRDLLNAAWLVRLQPNILPGQISNRVVELCLDRNAVGGKAK